MTTSLATANGKIEGLTANLTTANGEIDVLSADLAAANDEIETLTAGLATANDQIETLTTDLAIENDKIDALTTDLTTTNGEIDTLSATLANLTDWLGEELASLGFEIENLNVTDASISQKITSLYYCVGVGLLPTAPTTAEKMLQIACEAGECNAALTLGKEYLSGDHLTQDIDLAAKYLQIAADNGLDTDLLFAQLYLQTGNIQQALSLLEPAAQSGNTQACLILAHVYESDTWDLQDLRLARTYYEASGDDDAKIKISDIDTYLKAEELMEQGDYAAAADLYEALGVTLSADEKLEVAKNLHLANLSAGDTLTFGVYEQDNNSSTAPEPIEWLVLEVTDGKALLVSKYALDTQPYHIEHEATTWAECSLRTWLNSAFLSAAFNEDEQKAIQPILLTQESNPKFRTTGGDETTDLVFILSISQTETYFANPTDRLFIPTTYAIAQGAYTSSSYTSDGMVSCWGWLRTPGNTRSRASTVLMNGSIFEEGNRVWCNSFAVRPAIWVQLDLLP